MNIFGIHIDLCSVFYLLRFLHKNAFANIHSFSKLLFESIKFWHGAQTIILRAIICKQFYGLLKLANDVYVPKYMLIYWQ